ncbi:hypothetical protein [Algoriphagus confluentis]|uniref:phytoene desaturase family protein n=1 Tax=Algoriphagus confluentis TaxID=1697556 RepID=UPI0030C7089D
MAKIAGAKLPNSYLKKLKKFRYGMGVFKVDWALSGPIPFKSPIARKAGTIHLGSGMKEICHSELQAANGRISLSPFVLLGQQSLFDSTRAPKEMHTAWGYCHVPNGSNVDRTELIENQIERFAPGFKEPILARHSINSAQMEAYNHNYLGGDVNGGSMDIAQLFMKPTFQLKPYRTPAKGIYLCSSSTPPGGRVHGMCGYNAAKQNCQRFFS